MGTKDNLKFLSGTGLAAFTIGSGICSGPGIALTLAEAMNTAAHAVKNAYHMDFNASAQVIQNYGEFLIQIPGPATSVLMAAAAIGSAFGAERLLRL